MHQRCVDYGAQRAVADRPDLGGKSSLEQDRSRWPPNAFVAVVDGNKWDCPVGFPDSADDGRQHVRQLRRDDQESLLVGLRGDDLQQRHDLAGGGQAVSDQTVMADLEQFLDSAARETQDFDGGPRPERVVFLVTEVATLAGRRVVGPHLLGGAGDRASQRFACDGERLAGKGIAGGLQDRGGVLAPRVDGAHQHRQDR